MNGLVQFCTALARMSFTAGAVILVICLLRLCLKRAPKKYSYWLWAVAAFRLVCPVSLSAVFSLFSLSSVSTIREAGPVTEISYLPSVYGQVSQALEQLAPTQGPASPGKESFPWDALFQGLALAWVLGAAALLTAAVVSYLQTRRQVGTAVKLYGNVYESDAIRSPFVLGFFKPRVYIPFGLEGAQRDYVLSHEAYHIKRRDHQVKPLAFLILTVHWFNPLVWLAFHLMAKDMELSCDEKVLSELGEDARKEYSLSLLSFAENRRFPTPNPLSFGENGVKARVKNVMKYHKAKVWVSVLAAAACVITAAACATNPSATSVGIIGGADGPTSVFVSGDYTPENLLSLLYQPKAEALKALGLSEELPLNEFGEAPLDQTRELFGRGFTPSLTLYREIEGEPVTGVRYQLQVTDPSPEDMAYLKELHQSLTDQYGEPSTYEGMGMAEKLDEAASTTREDLAGGPREYSEQWNVPGYEEDYLTVRLRVYLISQEDEWGYTASLIYAPDAARLQNEAGVSYEGMADWIKGRMEAKGTSPAGSAPQSMVTNITEDITAYQGRHISISMEDLENMISRLEKAGASREEAEQEAPDSLAWLEVLAYRAREKGIAFTDEEYAQAAKTMREEAENASDYEEVMETLLRGTGMGEEQYWSELPLLYSFRREYLGQQFLEELREEFEAGKEENPMASWDVYLKKYREEAVAGEALEMTEEYRKQKEVQDKLDKAVKQAGSSVIVRQGEIVQELEDAQSVPSRENLPVEPPAPTPEAIPGASQAPGPSPVEG